MKHLPPFGNLLFFYLPNYFFSLYIYPTHSGANIFLLMLQLPHFLYHCAIHFPLHSLSLSLSGDMSLFILFHRFFLFFSIPHHLPVPFYDSGFLMCFNLNFFFSFSPSLLFLSLVFFFRCYSTQKKKKSLTSDNLIVF